MTERPFSESHKRQFKGVWIPARIWMNPKLNCQKKCILAEIDDNTPCTASNADLAKMFGISVSRVAHLLAELHNDGYIDTIGFDGRKRRMIAVTPKALLGGVLP